MADVLEKVQGRAGARQQEIALPACVNAAEERVASQLPKLLVGTASGTLRASRGVWPVGAAVLFSSRALQLVRWRCARQIQEGSQAWQSSSGRRSRVALLSGD
eukprot:scaffold171_cov263-Pinguiococcus_pyrenoidosus.AAC.10